MKHFMIDIESTGVDQRSDSVLEIGLVEGYLAPPGYETVDGVDRQVGDHHYRIYEMCGAVQLVQDVLGKPWEQRRVMDVVGHSISVGGITELESLRAFAETERMEDWG